MEDCAKYLNKIKILNESIWEGRVGRLAVEDWLNNFDYLEQAESLFVLSNFMYFGSRQMRTLMNAMYRDLYRAPIVYSIRKSNGDTMDSELIESKFIEALKHTKFLGIGNPSESGCHLLYFLRQENELPKTCFAHTHELFKRKENGDVPEGEMLLRNENVERYVFIDDFCGSGEQAKIELKGIVADLKKRKPDCIVSYYVLFATTDGLSHISSNVNFDEVEAVVKLDDSFKLFSDESRYFKVGEGQQKENLEYMCHMYGSSLCEENPCGFGDCQLLIGFHHNIPDNTLPIIWFNPYSDHDQWAPIFRRYHKKYSW